jgi:vancomycin resistance protein YoaR
LGNFAFGTLPLEVVKVNPKINSQMAQAAIPETKTLIAHETTFKAGDKTYEIKSADIIGMIDFVATPHLTGYELKPQITSEKVKPFVEKIASEVNHDPKDAKFQVQGGKVSTFQISEKGYKLDSAKATRQIVDALQNGSDTEIVLNVEEVNPEINSDDPSQSGITELIGEGKTSWRGSPANRIHNLTLGSQKLSGIIVKPGQEFSTIKNLAPIDAASGFLPELVIKNSNQVAPEIGGGLCQVSTTLFRAVLNSGLKITARSPHSFRVSYYEPPVGMDATIYDPAPDFKFVNNYSTSILVWAIPGNNSLDFQIYGTKDGRKIDISDPVVGDYVSAGADVYSESASMGAGDIRQVERATPGATASFNYKVTATDGTVLQDETYISKYVAIANSFLYGPGTTGIPGQEVQGAATAAPTPAPEPTAIPKK